MAEMIEVRRGLELSVSSETDLMGQYALELVAGLSDPETLVPTAYYYDDEGSRLFERLCEEPSYYLPSTETRILRHHALEMATAIGNRIIVELGSGNSTKTLLLLSAMEKLYGSVVYVPIDVNRAAIEKGATRILQSLGNVKISGFVAAYDNAIRSVAEYNGEKLFLFLGSTMAQFTDERVSSFLDMLRGAAHRGDRFLVGFDLFKDPEVLAKPYNTPVADLHQLNALNVINRKFDGNFDTARMSCCGRWNAKEMRIEMVLTFNAEQHIRLNRLNFAKTYPAGYETKTHIMRKMRPDMVEALICARGLTLERTWRDSQFDYGLFLFRFD
jgi:L-histidine Nalpha-methyltransferase